MKGKRKTVKDGAVSSANSMRSRAGVKTLRPAGGAKGKQGPSCSGSVSGVEVLGPAHQQIAERARVIWLRRGCVAGEDERNWLEAEAQLRQEMGLAKGSN